MVLGEGEKEGAYHRLDIWMRNGVKLVEVQLILWTDVDVSALILRAIAVFRCRKD
jgi:hypothetical protein